eukprot:COSAG01_NODE_1077_length_11839_cov_52.054093_15_plen_82_part_00
MGVILLRVCVFPRRSQNPILAAQLLHCRRRYYLIYRSIASHEAEDKFLLGRSRLQEASSAWQPTLAGLAIIVFYDTMLHIT